MRRFWIEQTAEISHGMQVTMTQNESRHITRVLRMKIGDGLELVDGTGRVYGAELIALEPLVEARIDTIRNERDEGAVHLTVFQGWLKGQKMETVIQKCTELGVNRFHPYWSSRCQGKLKEQQGSKKLARYQRVVEAACKQCYRSDLMSVEEPVDTHALLKTLPESNDRVKLLFWEEEKDVSLHDIAFDADIREMVIALGPEGGLTHEEAELFRSEGFQTVSLGNRILRAETATLTAVSLVQFLVKNI